MVNRHRSSFRWVSNITVMKVEMYRDNCEWEGKDYIWGGEDLIVVVYYVNDSN